MPVYANAIESFVLLFVLLNPFLMSVYLLDLIRGLGQGVFLHVLGRASAIAFVVYVLFAWMGEAFFSEVLQVRFASFLIFGGLIFFMISMRHVFHGSGAIEQLRGPPEHIAGAVAMPFMIGPGTVSASVIIGERMGSALAPLVILVSVAAAVACLAGFKWLHDWVRRRNEPLVERYMEILGRVAALVMGSIAVEMILKGVDLWLQLPSAS